MRDIGSCLCYVAVGALIGAVIGAVPLILLGVCPPLREVRGFEILLFLFFGKVLAILGFCLGAVIGAILWRRQSQRPNGFPKVAFPVLAVFFIIALFAATRLLSSGPGGRNFYTH
jgi:hypothetical protein